MLSPTPSSEGLGGLGAHPCAHLMSTSLVWPAGGLPGSLGPGRLALKETILQGPLNPAALDLRTPQPLGAGTSVRSRESARTEAWPRPEMVEGREPRALAGPPRCPVKGPSLLAVLWPRTAPGPQCKSCSRATRHTGSLWSGGCGPPSLGLCELLPTWSWRPQRLGVRTQGARWHLTSRLPPPLGGVLSRCPSVLGGQWGLSSRGHSRCRWS